MNIKAKVTCESVEEYSYTEDADKAGENITLRGVYSDSEENKTFSEATPVLVLNMTITNKSAFGAFVQGKEYFLDFTPA